MNTHLRRKRKQQLKRRRRLLRRIARDVVVLIMILGTFSAIFLSVRLVKWIANVSDESRSSETLVLTEEMFSSEEVQDVAAKLQAEGCPESLIELLEMHPETKEFVVNYEKNKDKEFEIDLSNEVLRGKIPLFLQWDERWGYEQYGDDFIAVTGCGPVCLSMVRCGLGGDAKWNPLEVAKMADDIGYYVEGEGSSWDLMVSGAAEVGLNAYTISFDSNSILYELQSGHPIICVVGKGDFTTTGHFIVLAGADEGGNVTVRDPNSRVKSSRTWHIDELMPQIRNLWGYYLTE